AMELILNRLAKLESQFINFLRVAIFIVMAWIGGLKAFQYEADGIVPFVANSPFMSFFYHKDAPEYQQYKNPEGKVVAENIAWHKENGTYMFSYFLGALILLIGLLTLLGIYSLRIGLWVDLLTVGMSIVTLSLLITNLEVYVHNLGGDGHMTNHGFPYLSGAGRLLRKDVIMMGGGLVCAADCAKRILGQRA